MLTTGGFLKHVFNRDPFSAQQLPLGVNLRDDSTLESYYVGDNQQALTQLEQMAKGTGEQFVFLWGREGVGRSHLLQGACIQASKYQRTSFYLSLANATPHDLLKLEGLERVNLVCIDDVDAIAGNKEWEEALFYLFNRLRAQQRNLLIAANAPPKSLGIKLADLQSRLTWGITYQLHALDDEQLLAALQLRAKQRGLILSNEVGAFLIKRCVRSMPDLYVALDTLDQASLVAQRRLTIPFVKEVLSL